MYLGAATNNSALTVLTFFQESVERYGFPLRVRGDRGHCTFNVYSSWHREKQFHFRKKCPQSKNRTTAVTSVYYDVLHYLEEANYLHTADQTHLFCCHYTFLPRLQDDLNLFRDGWDNHPLRTEHNMSPNQLWELGQIHYPVDDPQDEAVLLFMQIYSHVFNF